MTISDPEVSAIAKIAEALEAVTDPDARARVLNYILGRYKSVAPSSAPLLSHSPLQPVQPSIIQPQAPAKSRPRPKTRSKRQSPPATSNSAAGEEVDILSMVHHLKHMDSYSRIQQAILRKSTMVGRILLAISVYEALCPDGTGLSSGDMTKFFHQFNIKIAESNIAKAIRTSVNDYVTAAGLRGQGSRMRYKLTALGRNKLDELIQAT